MARTKEFYKYEKVVNQCDCTSIITRLLLSLCHPTKGLQLLHTKPAQASLVCGAFKTRNGRVWCVGEFGVRFVSGIFDAKVGLSVSHFLVVLGNSDKKTRRLRRRASLVCGRVWCAKSTSSK